jgi:hypothetical protein
MSKFCKHPKFACQVAPTGILFIQLLVAPTSIPFVQVLVGAGLDCPTHLQRHYLPDLFLLQAAEEGEDVHAIDELRPEVLPDL